MTPGFLSVITLPVPYCTDEKAKKIPVLDRKCGM